MSNKSEREGRTSGSNPGSNVGPGGGPGEAQRSDSVNSSKMPLRDTRTSKPGSNDAEQSAVDADREGASRQTSEAQDEAGQV